MAERLDHNLSDDLTKKIHQIRGTQRKYWEIRHGTLVNSSKIRPLAHRQHPNSTGDRSHYRLQLGKCVTLTHRWKLYLNIRVMTRVSAIENHPAYQSVTDEY